MLKCWPSSWVYERTPVTIFVDTARSVWMCYQFNSIYCLWGPPVCEDYFSSLFFLTLATKNNLATLSFSLTSCIIWIRRGFMPPFLRAFASLNTTYRLQYMSSEDFLRDCSKRLSTSLGFSLVSNTGHSDLFPYSRYLHHHMCTNLETVDFFVLTNPAIFLEIMFWRSHTIFKKRIFRLQTGLRREYFIVAFSRANQDEWVSVVIYILPSKTTIFNGACYMFRSVRPSSGMNVRNLKPSEIWQSCLKIVIHTETCSMRCWIQ